MDRDCKGVDLLFPPQWSPFQPPLSLPAIKAWLAKESLACRLFDANVEFYHWLFSDQAREILETALNCQQHDEKLDAYRAVLRCSDDFLADLKSLGRKGLENDDETDFLSSAYRGVKSLQTYLSVVSNVVGEFAITPYSFKTKEDMLSIEVINSFLENPPSLIASYLEYYWEKYLAQSNFVLGISCIGQEQLLFSLLFAKRAAKEGRHVVVGGTIFSRIQKRGLLPKEWLRNHISVVVHNEGEKPLSQLLGLHEWSADSLSSVEGISYLADDEIVTTKPAASLKPDQLPIPDFDDLPLAMYLTPEITLPILASRGCYWGHCEFCHHGMVYGEKYSTYTLDSIVRTVVELAAKYHVRYFSFNDEAVPPKLLRALGESDLWKYGLRFQALFKFEKYFTSDDFRNLFKVGFRSLYVGLESANERVLTRMRKNTKLEVIKDNLSAASAAGVWIHCFLFFGFPGETEEEARDTFDFVLENSEIIGSFGAGNFEFEYGAPISRHPHDFPLILEPVNKNRVDVYANYTSTVGISQTRASEIAQQLHTKAIEVQKYRAAQWIPREIFLIVLSRLSISDLIREGSALFQCNDIPEGTPIDQFISIHGDNSSAIFVNRLNRRAFRISSATAEALMAAHLCKWSASQIGAVNPDIMPMFGSQMS